MGSRARSSIAAAAVAAAVMALGVAACESGAPFERPEPVTCRGSVTAPTSIPTFAAAPDSSLAAGARWEATVRTTCGDVVLALDGAHAPRAVASFVELARSGYWDGSACDRLTARLAPTRLLQCGDPGGRGPASPGYDLGPENVPADHRYERGTVGMVTRGFDRTRAGEFFVVHEDFTAGPDAMVPPAVIGRVVSGMEVIEVIASAGVEDGQSDWHPFTNIDVVSVAVRPSPEAPVSPSGS